MKEVDFEHIKSLYLFRYKLMKERGLLNDDWVQLKKMLQTYSNKTICMDHYINKSGKMNLEFLDVNKKLLVRLEGRDFDDNVKNTPTDSFE